ncbi:hypothetical protein CVD28_01740 [Bacillus sp. M6-12]|uniref:hypothetical protein n=1 Tax=Bacillus sp. M6-12 TaxID=2054166 RepID=UPI000C756FCB|nr:hypothetical protein [Bacillus sp. M6-12]PLS19156.1 hypothetical protein CVD28_01740 [Bacillus sp. M6-12]
MKLIDNRSLSFGKGDIIVMDSGKKYWVIYENTCIAWYFLDLETFEFNDELHIDISTKLQVGLVIEGLGKVVQIIKADQIQTTIFD